MANMAFRQHHLSEEVSQVVEQEGLLRTRTWSVWVEKTNDNRHLKSSLMVENKAN
jgi:hypothetical protein